MIRVVHYGPDRHSLGGMASVIDEYLAMSGPDLSMASETTWGPASRTKGMFPAALAALRLLARRVVPSVAHVHLSENGSFLREGAVILAAKLAGVPVVASFHGADFERFASAHSKLAKTVCSWLDAAICLGPSHARIVTGLQPNLDVRIILNPVRELAADLQQEERADLLFVGELSRRKGFDRVMAAWEKIRDDHPTAKFLAAGPLADISVDEVDRFVYLGSLPREDVRQLMGRVATVCLPSRREVLPMTILESLAAGTTVVATRVGEYRSFDGCPAINWVSGTEDEIAGALPEAISASLDSVGEPDSGRAWVQANASTSVVRGALLALYGSLVTRDATRGRGD